MHSISSGAGSKAQSSLAGTHDGENHERLPRESEREKDEELGVRSGSHSRSSRRDRERSKNRVSGNSWWWRQKKSEKPLKHAGHTGDVESAVGGAHGSGDADSESDVAGELHDSVRELQGESEGIVKVARTHLAVMGTAIYLFNHHLGDTWGTGIIPDFLRTMVVATIVAGAVVWMLWSLLYFVDFEDLVDVLSRAEHAETLCWLTGVPILILLCLVAGDWLGWYAQALGVVSVVGALISMYMIDVNRQYVEHPNYTTSCDLGDRVSCTATMATPSNALVFGIRNSVIGLSFYIIIIACVVLQSITEVYFPVWVVFILCFCGALASIYLLQLSLAVLQIVCPVCTGAHLVNFALLWLAWGYSESIRW